MKKTLFIILILSTMIFYGCADNALIIEKCMPSWNCASWQNCINNSQARTCEDQNRCGTAEGMPAISQACTSPVADTTTATKPVAKPAGEYYVTKGEMINVEGAEVTLQRVSASAVVVSSGGETQIINIGATKKVGLANVRCINTFEPDAATIHVDVP